LPEIVLRVQFSVGGMAVDIENGEDRQQAYHPKVGFLLIICLILCDCRVIKRGFQVDYDQGPVEELTPKLEDLETGELEVLEVGVP
jgi:hypothetical protein